MSCNGAGHRGDFWCAFFISADAGTSLTPNMQTRLEVSVNTNEL